MKPIYSFTLKELYDNRDSNFIHHDKYTSELGKPELKYCYANTAVFEIKSSHYGEIVKKGGKIIGTNSTKYKIFVLFEDFYCIGKDKDIDFEDAIDYALNYGDVHIRCNCPAFLYWGYSYIGTQLKYLYGIPREHRYPHIRNPNVRGTICKHSDAVIQFCLNNKSLLAKMFDAYYSRLQDGQSIYAVNSNGTTITIGHKNDDGDIFFEKQLEEDEELEMLEKAKSEQGPEETEEQEDNTIDAMNPDSWWDEMPNNDEPEEK